jgi:hypothetical protein
LSNLRHCNLTTYHDRLNVLSGCALALISPTNSNFSAKFRPLVPCPFSPAPITHVILVDGDCGDSKCTAQLLRFHLHSTTYHLRRHGALSCCCRWKCRGEMGESDGKVPETAEANLDPLDRANTISGVAEVDNDNSARMKARRLYNGLRYVPPRCRYDPKKPFQFSMSLNILFGKTFPIKELQVLTINSVCRMLHCRKFVLYTSHPEPARPRFWCHLRAVVLYPHSRPSWICCRSAVPVSAG